MPSRIHQTSEKHPATKGATLETSGRNGGVLKPARNKAAQVGNNKGPKLVSPLNFHFSFS